jgi:hypothetical protein
MPCAYIDLYCVENAMIVEHWGFPAKIPPQKDSKMKTAYSNLSSGWPDRWGLRHRLKTMLTTLRIKEAASHEGEIDHPRPI